MDTNETQSKTPEPYFNMRGGGPGKAPAMTKAFVLESKPFMGGLNDRDASYLKKIENNGDAA